MSFKSKVKAGVIVEHLVFFINSSNKFQWENKIKNLQQRDLKKVYVKEEEEHRENKSKCCRKKLTLITKA